MNNLLVIERSFDAGSYAVYCDDKLATSGDFSGLGGGRSPEWFVEIKQALEAANVKPNDVTTVLVGMGPGSFSGIRAVLGAMQGLTIPFGGKVIGLTSVAAIALKALGDKESIAVCGDARRNTYWCAEYKKSTDGRLIRATGEELTHTTDDFCIITERKEGAVTPDAIFAPSNIIPKAIDLAALYFQDPSKAIENPLPIYLHPAVRSNSNAS